MVKKKAAKDAGDHAFRVVGVVRKRRAARQARGKPVGAEWASVSAPPTVRPARRFSDVSFRRAPYWDRRTGLRYADAAEYALLVRMTQDEIDARLEVRRARVVIK